MKNLLLPTIAFVLVAFVPVGFSAPPTPPSHATPKELQETIRALDKTYKQIKTFQADFTQTIAFDDFDTKDISMGRVFLKKGSPPRGKMRWDYAVPTSQQIFIEDDRLLYYVPEHQQVVKSSIGKQTGLPLDLFFGMDKMETLFNISRHGKHELLFIPKKDRSRMKQMLVTLTPLLNPSGVFIQKIVLTEQNGNRSTFLFSNVKINSELSDNYFSFKIPEGVEVIEEP